MRRPLIPLLAAGLIAGSFTAAPSAASPPDGSGAARLPAAGRSPVAGVVTLITGDRVDLSPGKQPQITPGKGRGKVQFRVSQDAGRVRVIPLDVVAPLAAGKLDPRLFDVTTLLEFGYDDARRSTLPLIVQRAGSAKAVAPLAGATAGRELPSIGGYVVQESKQDGARFWNSLFPASGRALAAGISKVWLNGLRRPTLDHSVPQIGAPIAWAQGLTGKGVTVAVVDTGIDATHPDLAGKVTAAKNFVPEDAGDLVGHGTHVASTVAGSGAASGGRYRGVAPDAKLLDAKVCQLDGCPDDAILAGMEWAAAEQKASVVNLSLGGIDGPEVDPLEQAVNTLSARYGTLFVVAAGNNGESGRSTVESPGSAAAALTVGAVDRDDVLAPFSGRGPGVGDSAVKPDLTAPGVDIVAARAAGTELGTPVDDHYASASGTSMATPHVVGSAAILVQQHPDWTGSQLKAALMSSAKVISGPGAFEQGAGRVDVGRAIKQQVVASPSSLSFGLAKWPHEDDQVLSRAVDYTNSGSTPVTLTLSVPGGPFAVAPSRLEIAAGGTARATVTADTRSPSVPVGVFSGQLVAIGTDISVSTPVGVEKEDERYQVDLTHLGRDGKMPDSFVTFFDLLGDCGDDPFCGAYSQGEGIGASSLRLRPGKYTLADFSMTGAATSMQMQAVFELRRDTSLVLDARTAKPVELTAPKTSARLFDLSVAVGRDMGRPQGGLTYYLGGGLDNPLFVSDLGGPAAAKDELVSVAQARFAEPGPAGDFLDSPYEYNLMDYVYGKIFNGVRLKPRQQEFAEVRAHYAADSTEPRTAQTRRSGSPADGPQLVDTPPTEAELTSSRMPFQRTEFYLAKGITWWSIFTERGGPQPVELTTDTREAFQPGRVYRKDWNKGVAGPRMRPVTIIAPGGAGRGAARDGDDLVLGLGLRGDSDPNHLSEPRLPAGSLRLYRDGEMLQGWPWAAYLRVPVPAAESTYRLESVVEVPGVDVSSKLTTTWTFRSGHVDGVAALPFMAMLLRPELDSRNRARTGGGYVVPIVVQRQPGAPAVQVKTVKVELSTDDGAIWRPSKVVPIGDHWQTTVTNPAGGRISLRTSVTDADGNKVEQTIIRGYLVD